ncbi:U-box domain-containing protein kinase family protein [Rhynchospora pubera]|uniref:RING-type E3 ubiquitin transferase n=1 Tax=Rhynchospora pubera TaxID=906938 RepID=A0AAV8GFK9_9POAL|nr:U-box domain-containing protein kinase family protein [Rhynchospora pubera]
MEGSLWLDATNAEWRPPAENIVLVALPENFDEGKSTLSWALNYFSGNDSVWFAITHVYTSIKMIPFMGMEIDTNHLGKEYVDAYRKLERERLDEILIKYLSQCQQTLKLKCLKLLVEAEDTFEGLLDIIRTHDISKVIVGKVKESRPALLKGVKRLTREVKPSCNLWFFYNGKLIFTRTPHNNGEASTSSSAGNRENFEMNDDEEGQIELGADPYENIREKAFDVFIRHQNAEKEVFWGWQKAMLLTAKMSSEQHLKDVQWKRDIEDFLEKEKKEKDQLKQEIEQLMLEKQQLTRQWSMNSNRTDEVNNEREKMERRILEAEIAVKDIQSISAAARDRNESLEAEKASLQQELSNATSATEVLQSKFSSLEQSYNQLLLEFNIAASEKEQLHDQRKRETGTMVPMCTEFPFEEIKRTTENFSASRKIGEGGFGPVYKGFLRNTMVAIKKLDPTSLQSSTEFEQEISVLGKVRHPNIITLIGSCPEASALVYEYLANGNLNDRLNCRGNTPPLTWRLRTRIIGEVCSALIFLHSAKPHPIVHGDLKPDNILLDSNFVSKIGDFGIARLLRASRRTSAFHRTNPKGTNGYIDPEFLTTGELTTQSDVYSLGIIILQLLTGKPVLKIAQYVEAASDEDLMTMIDLSAGSWPFVHARKLAYIGVRCSNVSRKNRPDLIKDVWPRIVSLARAAMASDSPSCESIADENHAPSYFICPIVQEIMKEPHMAADGYTYEFTAIKGWFDGGHNTSPMTNLPLTNLDLIPNHPLRSTIQDWLQKHQKV